jgi:hypothetical protein
MRVASAALLFLLLLSLGAIIFAGLMSKQFDSANNAGWVNGEDGIGFPDAGLAYVDSVVLPQSDRFTIDLTFTSSRPPAEGFSFILVLHDGRDRNQLVIGQWQSWIIVMNGNDYAHTRREPRLSFDLGELDSGKVELSLSSDPAGTSIAVNGLQLDAMESVMTLPQRPGRTTRLVLGNSVYARNPWSGTVHDIVIQPVGPDGDAVGPTLAMRSGLDWEIPESVIMLQRDILSIPHARGTSQSGFLYDVAINLAGFIPLGAILVALLSRTRFVSSRKSTRTDNRLRAYVPAILLALLAGAVISCAIEVAQAWLPARSSSLVDLLLNTLGATVGATAVALLLTRLQASRADS